VFSAVGSAGLLVEGVLTLVGAVLLHLEALTVVDLRLHRDVVAPFALGAFEGHFDPLVALGHFTALSISVFMVGAVRATTRRPTRWYRAGHGRQSSVTSGSW